ncbi:hypothetical protein C427_0618 [Paraglaciecola psychrophila 170]|uniref:Uncharacterized protein n=1 Tax=Paraglaciecola psychrophila 170 TaxID=1129794 RepID=M4RJH1_9ALTE|nr:hypothetical protein C427_0618 [Paraglaciecola psychrophila 170]
MLEWLCVSNSLVITINSFFGSTGISAKTRSTHVSQQD